MAEKSISQVVSSQRARAGSITAAVSTAITAETSNTTTTTPTAVTTAATTTTTPTSVTTRTTPLVIDLEVQEVVPGTQTVTTVVELGGRKKITSTSKRKRHIEKADGHGEYSPIVAECLDKTRSLVRRSNGLSDHYIIGALIEKLFYDTAAKMGKPYLSENKRVYNNAISSNVCYPSF